MKIVNGVKIPKRKKTSPEFRKKWSKIIDSYSLAQCQKLKDRITKKATKYTMTTPYSAEERYLLVLLRKRLSPVKIYNWFTERLEEEKQAKEGK